MTSGLLNPGEIDSLKGWLETEAVTLPEGWLEACLEWLSEQSDFQMTPQQLREAVYQQWLHSDFNQLGCSILPDQTAAAQETLLLEGELCLQISALINISESYYGQLRKLEGNLGKDVPDLETHDVAEEDLVDPSIATQSFSSSYRPTCYHRNTATYALHLTDGVNTIKAVELGSKSSANVTSPEEWFRVGAKVKLRGPLKLRKGVLILPNGTISNPNLTAQSSNSQCCFLGGESVEAVKDQMEVVQNELLVKLNLPPDNPPEWFPGRRYLPASVIDTGRSVQYRNSDVDIRVAESVIDEDDLLLASAVEKFENSVSAVGDDAPLETADTEASDNDVAVDAILQEINFSPQSDLETNSSVSATPTVTPCKRTCLPSVQSVVDYQTNPPHRQASSDNVQGMTKAPLLDIRRFLKVIPSTHRSQQQHQATTETASPIPQFAYLQDVYYNLQQRQRGSGMAIYSIRGVLVSVQSRLEHHEGQQWSLRIRLSDGTATVDASVGDDLLRRLIGLSAVEAEAMRQLGRQGDASQKQKLRDIISAFQLKLCHFSGIFEVVFPDSSSNLASEPRIRQFRLLDQQWLSYLQSRAA